MIGYDFDDTVYYGDSTRDFIFYCLKRQVKLKDIVLLPGETDDVMWATFDKVHQMIAERKICRIIANQFLRQEPDLVKRQTAQE